MPAVRMWTRLGAAAVDRGWHWLAFHGTDPDVLCNAVCVAPDVDVERMALVAFNCAGVTLPRERGFAAVVFVPGISASAAIWLDAAMPSVRVALDAGDRAGFERELYLAELFAPGSVGALQRIVGHSEASQLSLYDACRRVVSPQPDQPAAVHTPVLVCDDSQESSSNDVRNLCVRLPPQVQTCGRFDAAVVLDWVERTLASA
jgi:hypothetical protein